MSEPKRQRAGQRKHHFVYRTTCVLNDKYYIGLHSTDNFEDGYLGSGWRLQNSIKKYGKENFKREILESFQTRKEASLREEELITPEILSDPLCLNLRSGGTGQSPGYSPPKDTRKKLSEAGKARWQRDRVKLKEQIAAELKNFTMTRAEILEVLVTPQGYLNKNASRYLPPKQDKHLGNQKLGKREVLNQAKWKFIWQAIQNSEFGDDPVELINAYVNQLQKRPTCKVCSNKVSFFRFNRPYATYCSNHCQLLDPEIKNPVLSRWATSTSRL
jgi:hypothetical protein